MYVDVSLGGCPVPLYSGSFRGHFSHLLGTITSCWLRTLARKRVEELTLQLEELAWFLPKPAVVLGPAFFSCDTLDIFRGIAAVNTLWFDTEATMCDQDMPLFPICKSLVVSPPAGVEHGGAPFHVSRMPEHVMITPEEIPPTVANFTDPDNVIGRFMIEHVELMDVRSWGVLRLSTSLWMEKLGRKRKEEGRWMEKSRQ
uniref:Uncharacterized protein n=1 Tax=Oryza brachyantha TaxID=4533 RepID=J3KZ30_ORYBR